MSERQKQIQQWWDHKKTIYPFLAEGKANPIEVFYETQLNFVSVVLDPTRPGFRTWGFKTATDRQIFLNLNIADSKEI